MTSHGADQLGRALAQFAGSQPQIRLFASVAFKYRPHEPDPPLAAKNALDCGFIPTTSGIATGVAADLGKIVAMSKAIGGKLAIASGMTPENIGEYAPYLSDCLVSTGISLDDFRIDEDRLARFIAAAQRVGGLARENC